jgi:hypothetical protein
LIPEIEEMTLEIEEMILEIEEMNAITSKEVPVLTN